MTYIIAEPCVDVMDRACVDVCPVDCIYEVGDTELSEGDAAYKQMLYIHPEECIDCGACEPECPVEAIFPEDETPDKWNEYIAYNYEAFGMSAP
jgi:NAD-dependent dihydropyrimidine dehydrogenase PreA subunit